MDHRRAKQESRSLPDRLTGRCHMCLWTGWLFCDDSIVIHLRFFSSNDSRTLARLPQVSLLKRLTLQMASCNCFFFFFLLCLILRIRRCHWCHWEFIHQCRESKSRYELRSVWFLPLLDLMFPANSSWMGLCNSCDHIAPKRNACCGQW